MKSTERKVYEEHVVTQEGEVVSSRTIYNTNTEPPYVKLYIDCVLTVKGLQKGLNPILIGFLEHMSYAGTELYGGQIIFVNKALKECIANKLKVGIKRIDQAITQFVKANIFKRVAVGTYQVNPNIIGKGEWKDIKKIKANFDFNTGEIIAEIIREVGE